MAKRIIVISEDFVEPWDEGIKKFAYSVGKAFELQHEVLMLNVDRSGFGDGEATRWLPSSRTFMSADLRREMRAFSPDVVVYVPSPSATLSSFMRCFVLRRHAPRALIGMVGLMPRSHPLLSRPVIEMAQPDVTFVPSYKSLLYYRDMSVRSELLPIGVDLDTFAPSGSGDSRGEKLALRRRHGIALNSQVFLHIGHLSPRRNLDVLKTLAAVPGCEVILVGSTSTEEDRGVRAALEAAGVRVIREYVPVHEFYRLADCYVFPTRDAGGCVEIPLSVFEALASGLPVLAQPFGGLRDFLPAGADLQYWETEDDLIAAAAAMRLGDRPRVRDMHPFAWEQVAERILATLHTTVA